MKRLWLLFLTVLLIAAAWAVYDGAAPQLPSSFAALMPQEAMLYLEAQDFRVLLRDWDASPQKQVWLKSDNYEVFSRSRLLLRLQSIQQEFAAAAGVPPDLQFLHELAGDHSALALYDIGKLQLLYITHVPDSRALNSRIWQQRSKFESREVAGRKFYVRTDAQSERVVAFALEDDLLILGTREDLVAGALTLLAKQKAAKLSEEGWFVAALKTAGEAGELRMVVHLAEVAHTPQFSTYWVQQNVTEMRGYESSVSDLFRTASSYREERVLLPADDSKNAIINDGPQVAELVRLVPPAVGFYRAQAQTEAASALQLLESKVLAPRLGPTPVSKLAPVAGSGGAPAGDQSNLEVRIDEPLSAPTAARKSDEQLQQLLEAAKMQAALQLHRSEASQEGVFVRLHSAVVLSATQDWNEAAAQSAIQRVLASGLTAAGLGTGWKRAGAGPQSYWEIDGLAPVFLSVRGKYLFVSNDAELLTEALARVASPVTAAPAVDYAGFDHERERQNYERLTELIDRPSRVNQGNSEGREPEFFSQNTASLSRTFARVKSQSMVVHGNNGVQRQTVRYEWEQ